MSCDNEGVTECNTDTSFEPNVLPFLVLLCAIVGVELFAADRVSPLSPY